MYQIIYFKQFYVDNLSIWCIESSIIGKYKKEMNGNFVILEEKGDNANKKLADS